MRTLAVAAVLSLSPVAALAAQETLVRMPSGERMVVRTDEAGTTVKKDEGGRPDVPVGPGEEERWTKVRELTKAGGEVRGHKTEQ